MSCSCNQGAVNGACCRLFQYAAKAVCGIVAPPAAGSDHTKVLPGSPGTYYTAINVHNPSECDSVTFRWKVAEALSLSLEGQIRWSAREFTLRPDQAIEIDTGDILQLISKTFLKGYVIIEAEGELDVVSVYSGNNSTTNSISGPLNLFHTERVPARVLPVGDHLILPLNPGVADWRYIGTSPGPYNQNSPVALQGTVQGPWELQKASQLSTDFSSTVPPGITKRYQLCFDLCCGFVAANTNLRVQVDDEGTLRLNGTPFGATIPINPTVVTMPGNLLKEGKNCLEIDVRNTQPPAPGATGFSINGLLSVPRGRCCCEPLPLLRMSPGLPNVG